MRRRSSYLASAPRTRTNLIDTVPRTLTLTTDFGTRDAYVAAMKGTMLGICPDVRMVDVTHEIAPQDVMEAAFVLREAVPFFPPGTIHLAVVDPGVGTARRAVALRQGDRYFVGPDNGIFTLVLDGAAPDEAVVLDRPDAWRTPEASATFHGRDVFAPAAAHLAAGRALADLGTPITGLEPLRWLAPATEPRGIQGWVVHIDHFGNCITNVSRALFEEQRRDRPFRCFAGNTVFCAVHPTYGAVAAGESLLLFGSSGRLEVAVNAGNAAELLGIRKGDAVTLAFQEEAP